MGEWIIDPHFLDLGTSCRWVVSFTPLPHYPRERAPGTQWTPEPVWTIWRSENFLPYRDSNSRPPVVQPVASRYTDWAIPAPKWYVELLTNSWSDKGRSPLVRIFSFVGIIAKEIHDDIKRITSGSACYYSVQKMFLLPQLSRAQKSKIC
jgi:hypothetical protein